MKEFSAQLLTLSDNLKPRRIIFEGGIAIKQAKRIRQLAEQLQKTNSAELPLLEISQLGEDAGLYGALGLLK